MARRPVGLVAYACWFHGLGPLTVLVMFALPGESRQEMVDSWHPCMGNRLTIADFREPMLGQPVSVPLGDNSASDPTLTNA